MDVYDAIVVGGGPAGGTAAYFLGEAGKRVLVLEKEELPRYKPCGGGISSRILQQFPFSFEPVIECRPQAIRYALGPRNAQVRINQDEVLMVMRDRFDAHLLKHAHADIRTGTTVKRVTESLRHVEVETGDGERFRARFVVGADGANSRVARGLGLRHHRTLAAAVEAEVSVPVEIMHRFAEGPMFIFGEVDMGYLWVFPKRSHLSVGIGALRPRQGQLKSTLQRVMSRYGIALDGARQYGHPLPIYWGRERISTARVALAGDAAGLVDPFTGEGIRMAIKSGRLAADAILAGSLEQYPVHVDRAIGGSQRVGLALSQLFYRFPTAAWQLAVRNPFASEAFVDLISDRTSYWGVLATLAGTLPLYASTELTAGTLASLGAPDRAAAVRSAVFGSMAPVPA